MLEERGGCVRGGEERENKSNCRIIAVFKVKAIRRTNTCTKSKQIKGTF